MSRKSVVANTMILGTVVIILSSAINLLIVPFITQRLGVEAYGFVTLARNIAEYAGIAMLALNSFSARFMAVSYMQCERKEFSEYYSTVFISDTFIGAVLFLIGIIFSIFSNNILNIPNELSTDVPVLFIIIFLSSYLMFATVPFQAVTYTIKRLDLYNGIRIIGYLVQAFILIFLFSLCKGTVCYVGFAYLGQYLAIFMLCYWVKQKYVGDVRARMGDFSVEKLIVLLSNGIWNSVNQIGNVLNSGLDLIVTNLYLTAEVMGIISVTKTVSGLFSTLNQTVSQAFQPTFLQLFSEDRQDDLLKELKRSAKVCGLVANTVFITFIIFGKDFYKLWLPTSCSKEIYILTILAIIPSLLEGYISPLGYIYTIKMKNKVPCFVTIVGGVANVGGMIVLLSTTSLGEYAVLGTTTVIMSIIYLIFSPIYMAHCLQIKATYFFPSIFQNLIVAAFCCTVSMLLKNWLPGISGWLNIILIGGCFAVVLLLLQMFILLGKDNSLSILRKVTGGKA